MKKQAPDPAKGALHPGAARLGRQGSEDMRLMEFSRLRQMRTSFHPGRAPLGSRENIVVRSSWIPALAGPFWGLYAGQTCTVIL